MYKIGDFRSVNKSQNILVTIHGQIRLKERNISVEDIIAVINSGEIIEQYEDDYPLPSCLIFGKTCNNRDIHIVVSLEEEIIYLITAYEPNLRKWESGFKQRKRGNEHEVH